MMRVPSLVSLSGFKDSALLQAVAWVTGGSGIAVAVAWASSCSSDSTPSLGISICHGCGPKKKENMYKGMLGRAMQAQK